MSRLENAIKQVKESRIGKNHAWIYDDNGNISDKVICGEALKLLEELKEYEINVSDKFISDFLDRTDIKSFNSYNVSGNISNDINIDYLERNNTCIIIAMVHLAGDIRCNYSEYFALKMDSLSTFMELESMRQIIPVTDTWYADVDLMCETYPVWDSESGEEIGYFCDIDKEELMNDIEIELS